MMNFSIVSFLIFSLSGLVGLLLGDYYLGAHLGLEHAHTFAHFCFGLGFPFLWVSMFAGGRKAGRQQWQINFDNRFIRPFGCGLWLGVAITALWSVWNEIIVYWLFNPSHSADWHHWGADLGGIAAAFAVFRVLIANLGQPDSASI